MCVLEVKVDWVKIKGDEGITKAATTPTHPPTPPQARVGGDGGGDKWR